MLTLLLLGEVAAEVVAEVVEVVRAECLIVRREAEAHVRNHDRLNDRTPVVNDQEAVDDHRWRLNVRRKDPAPGPVHKCPTDQE